MKNSETGKHAYVCPPCTHRMEQEGTTVEKHGLRIPVSTDSAATCEALAHLLQVLPSKEVALCDRVVSALDLCIKL